jgi:hypothetical protein
LGFKPLPFLGRLQNLLLPLYFRGNVSLPHFFQPKKAKLDQSNTAARAITVEQNREETEVETPGLVTPLVETPKVEISAEKKSDEIFSIQESSLKLAVQEALLNPAFVEQFAEKLEQARKTRRKMSPMNLKLFGLKMTIFGFAMLAFVILIVLQLHY